MNEYIVEFEIKGRKFKGLVKADDPDIAKRKMLSVIKFTRVELVADPVVEDLMNKLGMK